MGMLQTYIELPSGGACYIYDGARMWNKSPCIANHKQHHKVATKQIKMTIFQERNNLLDNQSLKWLNIPQKW